MKYAYSVKYKHSTNYFSSISKLKDFIKEALPYHMMDVSNSTLEYQDVYNDHLVSVDEICKRVIVMEDGITLVDGSVNNEAIVNILFIN